MTLSAPLGNWGLHYFEPRATVGLGPGGGGWGGSWAEFETGLPRAARWAGTRRGSGKERGRVGTGTGGGG